MFCMDLGEILLEPCKDLMDIFHQVFPFFCEFRNRRYPLDSIFTRPYYHYFPHNQKEERSAFRAECRGQPYGFANARTLMYPSWIIFSFEYTGAAHAVVLSHSSSSGDRSNTLAQVTTDNGPPSGPSFWRGKSDFSGELERNNWTGRL